MGEIIEFRPSHAEPPEEPNSETEKQPVSEEWIDEFISLGAERTVELTKKANTVLAWVESLQDKPSKEALTERMERVNSYTVQQLAEFLDRADQSECSARPAFFLSVAQEYMERVLASGLAPDNPKSTEDK